MFCFGWKWGEKKAISWFWYEANRNNHNLPKTGRCYTVYFNVQYIPLDYTIMTSIMSFLHMISDLYIYIFTSTAKSVLFLCFNNFFYYQLPSKSLLCSTKCPHKIKCSTYGKGVNPIVDTVSSCQHYSNLNFTNVFGLRKSTWPEALAKWQKQKIWPLWKLLCYDWKLFGESAGSSQVFF